MFGHHFLLTYRIAEAAYNPSDPKNKTTTDVSTTNKSVKIHQNAL